MPVFQQPSKLLVICGPTASGKTELALTLAHELDAEIVNADSMQVYRGMDIGTAKPSTEQRTLIPHHLIDVASPDRLFSAADFADAADAAIREITGRGKRVIVVGGTGLYLRALLQGLVDSPSGAGAIRQELQAEARAEGNAAMLEKLWQVDPELAAHIHPNNLVRIIRALEVHRLTGIPLSRYQREHGFSGRRYDSIKIGLSVERQELYGRIEARVDRMLAEGLLEEVRGLLSSGYGRELKAMRAIGYKEAAAHLDGECSLEDAAELIKRDTRRYAKRQLTWFKADPDIIWLEYPANFVSILHHAIEFFDH
ncbi:tRNA (adenosine(37)-N6)-dimethylallyltransferase MiaA [Geobacter sp. SVR]|uniref:tRNA (adenosine(37)-N6)-dimethylallyltransferase MiaA n=1 Tax=Geobacter sp. SVR TaxID=2495594 RepID=UPI00143EFD89|nr:tRNA (adenosine(37)-N6)-dimethylallyltransferase MiaA [Geobacter sp. SVR]BCS55362.1 tRNA dimethylallyltransferase [Geobacter sp. SVR]GCF87287.1 tRNA dimethylallyltransferase [Geobacter sp. SVR]